MSALKTSDIVVNRAGLPVVRGASIMVERGSVSVLLGANGAGKTTFLEGLSGIAATIGGAIELNGEAVHGLRPGARARRGLAHVEQGRTVFRTLTTEENLRAVSKHVDVGQAYVFFPELEKRKNVLAGLLSGGEQQMLVIARALLMQPKVIMIDEMSAGLAPIVVARLMAATSELARQGLAVLLVEQFAALALSIGDRAYVMRRGRIVYDGPCAALAQSPELLHQLYLGDAAGM
ncbi:ABC transporter ATP-binding protein [Bradyrhizobium sp. KB893862 SZCCT0404]|uniref:ABC transporter ATP-binding protein n=1 Tax=Bradyrhizobium sp. KB893862 SZCCT0404 TaxID=2807672 RepID=UPI001BAA4982|nr:ABC transporter ATP-binding protein [Bradyrhizobium sp. KB893862 SZCCT0404]MBR1177167.1 ABC transporter ATP-binding protein [Bradyrhizobium sp. KB893862 SZCCT0404]